MAQYRHRRTSNPATAFPATIEPGEITVNTANRQIAVGDAAAGSLGATLPLIGVRIFDARAQYVLNDAVMQGGNLYKANGAISPGAFNAGQWTLMANAAGNYLLKAGDTMTGALIINANTNPLTVNAAVNNGIRVSDGTRVGLFAPSSFGGIVIGAATNHALHLMANNAERVTVLGDGKVGINHTNPDARLTIKGDNATSNFRIKDASDVTRVSIGSGYGFSLANAAGTSVHWLPTDGTVAWLNAGGGHLGVGTTTPGFLAPLDPSTLKNIVTIFNPSNVGVLELATGSGDASGVVAGQVCFVATSNVPGGGLAQQIIATVRGTTAGAAANNRGGDLGFFTKGDGAAAIALRAFVSKDGHFVPGGDNLYACGFGGLRFTQIWAVNGAIQTSDENEKEMIEDSDLGLAFINQVRPIMYRERTDAPKDGDGQPWRYGVSAQQVQHALGDKPFAGLVQDPESGVYGTSYTAFVAPLIKAVQELTTRVEALEGPEPRT